MRLILSLILLATISFAAAPTPINNLLLQGNENANGYSITNLVIAGPDSATTVSYVSNAIHSIVFPAALVQSVNGKTGTVVLTYSDVGADIEGSALGVFNWIQLQNYVDKSVTNGLASTNYVNSKIQYVPVLSVNSKTGNVVLSANDVNADIYGSASAVSNWVAMQSYVDKSVTNGLSSISFVTSQGYVTAIITNGLVTQSSLTSQLLNYYLNSNQSNYVTKVITNGLASVSYVNGQGYVTANITNGFASVSWVQSQNYVDNSITNGFATTNYVNNAISALPPSVGNVVSVNGKTGVVIITSSDIGAYPNTNPSNYVDKTITNGLYSSSNPNNYVDKTITNGLVTETITNGLYSSSNPNNYVDKTITNGLVTSSITNGLVTQSITNGLYSSSNPNNYVDKSVTNGLASVSWIQLQNYVTQSITNGLASISQLSGMITNNMDNVIFGSNTIFNGDIWIIGNIYVKNIWTTNSVIIATNMNITGTLTVNGNSVLTNGNAYELKGSIAEYSNYVDSTYYKSSNPNNYVDKTVTNGLVTSSITNGLVTSSITNGLVTSSITNGLVTQSITNGLYSSSNPNNYVDKTITNGLVTQSITNGLYSSSNPNNYVDKTITNGLYSSSNPANYVDKTITNGLVATNDARYLSDLTNNHNSGLYVSSDGKVGIKTNAPRAQLDVNGSYYLQRPSSLADGGNTIGGVIMFANTDFGDNANGYLKLDYPNTSTVRFGTDYDGHLAGIVYRDIQFGRLSSPYLTVKDLGNIGILTTNPTERLHVVGNITNSGWIASGTGFYGSGASLTGITAAQVGAYPNNNPSNYVDKTITNGLYSSSNPNNYVDKTVTNGLVTQSITNGLYSASNPNNYVDKTITNGLASISYVTNQITLATNALWITVTNNMTWKKGSLGTTNGVFTTSSTGTNYWIFTP